MAEGVASSANQSAAIYFPTMEIVQENSGIKFGSSTVFPLITTVRIGRSDKEYN